MPEPPHQAALARHLPPNLSHLSTALPYELPTEITGNEFGLSLEVT